MLRSLVLAAAAAAVVGAGCPDAGTPDGAQFPAILSGHAILPARTFVEAPRDAPSDFATSGKFVSSAAADLPFPGQPVQGFSGISRMPDGSFMLLTDNGAGSKSNSADYLLMLNRYRIDFTRGEFDWRETIFLRDPDGKVPFRIVAEDTPQRYLTGADFDPESLVVAGGALWIGEEFGPFLIKADPTGRVLGVYQTLVDGVPVRSPDHPARGMAEAGVGRSRGIEGMAVSSDGRMLYPMFEGPLDTDRAPFVRILEFDTVAHGWTGRYWRYPLEAEGLAIGEMTMLGDSTALVIERDTGAGTPDRACGPGQTVGCFPEPAAVKRVYKIDMGEDRSGGDVRKIGFIDLMAIDDPSGLARTPTADGLLALPFPTIETLAVVDDRHIVVGNDNNSPFSRSRQPDLPDDSEVVLLDVGPLLDAC